MGKDSGKTCVRDGAAIVPVCLTHSLLSLPGSGLGWGVGKGTGEIPVSLLASVDAAAKKSTDEVHFKPGPAQAVPSNKRSLSVAASGPLATNLQ